MNTDPLNAAIRQACNPANFFVGSGFRLRVVETDHDVARWEIFQGHLLPPTQTRNEKTFRSWNLFLDSEQSESTAPIISIKVDESEQRIFVVRCILMQTCEAYEERPNVILSRPVKKWIGELVGSITLCENITPDGLLPRLTDCLSRAVVGTSRLPITSLESPLPAYLLGQLSYVPGHDAGSICDLEELIRRKLSSEMPPACRARLLETVLRALPGAEVDHIAETFWTCWRSCGLSSDDASRLLRDLFNHLALSPYTDMIDRLIGVLRHWSSPRCAGPELIIDAISYMLRHLVRHLTAYDLVTFHHAGANYPDAMMLDALLRAYLQWIDQDSSLFHSTDNPRACLRRRALRQACLVRQQYQGHLVPDLPTSPGENARVLPAPYAPVPEAQLVDLSARTRRLYHDRTLSELISGTVHDVLNTSFADLGRDDELRELGMGVFLDRPLGVSKQPGHIDRTPLLSYEAFSRTIAAHRLERAASWGLIELGQAGEKCRQQLREMPVPGYPAARLPGSQRPGVVALEDARVASEDFVLLRTTRRSLDELLGQYDFSPLARRFPALSDWLFTSSHVLMIRVPSTSDQHGGLITCYDKQMRPRLELDVQRDVGQEITYVEQAGVERLKRGLRVCRVWEGESDAPGDLGNDPIELRSLS